ncbi:MAG: taurine ABC transporter substrate-binding protein [Pelagibacteraceae bacterium BACL5 MAG-121128-bin54]|jgi:taurine transport system substrate-binding protein|nr:MAG: taurine ABC transporter substrate-binding protein [Pelagibacteraceae bacterium BACL5 MAG-121128-bin54]
MKKIISFILGSIVALNLSISVANSAANEVRVAFFLEWPTPNQEDKVKGTFEKALGVPVKWTNFTNGGAMTDAMLSGDIDISYSQGLVPFINAVKSKAPIKLVDIAMEYGMGGTTCVTSNASGITKANATELEGKKVAVPLGTMAEYVFDESMKVVGADRNKMEIIQMDPEEGAAALVSGDVVMACLFGGNSIKAATEVGSRLLTVDEARAAGILGIDITSVTDKFMKENPGMVRTFIEVSHEANARYKAGKSDLGVIAKDAEMKLEDSNGTLSGFKFLDANETKTSMESGNLHKFLQGMGTPKGFVDTSYLPL